MGWSWAAACSVQASACTLHAAAQLSDIVAASRLQLVTVINLRSKDFEVQKLMFTTKNMLERLEIWVCEQNSLNSDRVKNLHEN